VASVATPGSRPARYTSAAQLSEAAASAGLGMMATHQGCASASQACTADGSATFSTLATHGSGSEARSSLALGGMVRKLGKSTHYVQSTVTRARGSGRPRPPPVLPEPRPAREREPQARMPAVEADDVRPVPPLRASMHTASW